MRILKGLFMRQLYMFILIGDHFIGQANKALKSLLNHFRINMILITQYYDMVRYMVAGHKHGMV